MQYYARSDAVVLMRPFQLEDEGAEESPGQHRATVVAWGLGLKRMFLYDQEGGVFETRRKGHDSHLQL